MQCKKLGTSIVFSTKPKPFLQVEVMSGEATYVLSED